MASNNLPSVTIETFRKIVQRQFEEHNMRPIFGLGKGGIGKTEAIMSLAKDVLHVGHIDIRLLLYGETDLKGIPYPNAEHTRTIWLQNNILPNEQRDGKEGILVFDEITSCARSVRTAAYQLLNERRLGEYVLPDGWLVVCLGNGEDDGGDFNGMEGNFANRCSVYNVVPNVEAWKEWAVAVGVHPLVTAYVSFKPEDLHSYNPDSETELLFASPRSWTAVSNILKYDGGYKEGDEIQMARISGNVGNRVGQQFSAFCKHQDDTIDPMEIIEKGVEFKPQSQEVIYITIESIVKLMWDIIDADEKQYGKVRTETLPKIANGLNWILDLRTEYAVMGYKDFLKAGNSVISIVMSPDFHAVCPKLIEFANKNSSIFT